MAMARVHLRRWRGEWGKDERVSVGEGGLESSVDLGRGGGIGYRTDVKREREKERTKDAPCRQ